MKAAGLLAEDQFRCQFQLYQRSSPLKLHLSVFCSAMSLFHCLWGQGAGPPCASGVPPLQNLQQFVQLLFLSLSSILIVVELFCIFSFTFCLICSFFVYFFTTHCISLMSDFRFWNTQKDPPETLVTFKTFDQSDKKT